MLIMLIFTIYYLISIFFWIFINCSYTKCPRHHYEIIREKTCKGLLPNYFIVFNLSNS